ncbi:hypothetical protein [Streptococcus gallolyticus]|uniref:hypothetical protein n=1 Tax=Streptococcus gallolyticus TaxID=315405 RepID=UPI002283B61F|nr:hypothetical protein [Streptococcus gallolyticus]MCY7187281.1 hypothetical protein [Streptococcus gallolyticus subsp. gallolyticus]
MPSTLYGINSKNELTVVKEYQNSFSACYPAWDYFEKKYFNKNVGLEHPECWKLGKHDMEMPFEYFTLLSTFDGYIFNRANLSQMISLLEEQSIKTPNLTRLQMFSDAQKSLNFDTFFITANSISGYENFIEYHWDEENMVEISPPTLTESIWDIWEEYVK